MGKRRIRFPSKTSKKFSIVTLNDFKYAPITFKLGDDISLPAANLFLFWLGKHFSESILTEPCGS